jgi:hypothetical protein
MAAASTLTVYRGREALATIEVHWIKGCAEYRARLAGGKKLGTFDAQKAARKAIDDKLGEQSA